MLYVIPFILLLVIALVLKKRENANKEQNTDKPKKINTKTASNKNAPRTARTAPTARVQNQPVDDVQPNQLKTSALNVEFKTQIEKLIAEKNFSSAEIKINQSLNQDNTQHELYLYLLDIHLAHQDDLAIHQLLNYIRSLKLTDILNQALLKQKNYTEKNHSNKLDQHAADLSHNVQSKPKNQAYADFDALVDTEKNDRVEFQFKEPQPATSIDNTAERSPLTFNLSPMTEEKSSQEQPSLLVTESHAQGENQPTETRSPLEFNLDFKPKVEDAIQAPTESHTSVENKHSEVTPPLEFNFDFKPKVEDAVQAPTESHTPVENKHSEVTPPLEFNFDFKPKVEDAVQAPTESHTPVENKHSEAIPPLEFNLDFKPKVKDVVQATTEPAATLETPENLIEFKIDFAELNTPLTQANESPQTPIADLEFTLDPTPIQSSSPLNFDLAVEKPTVAAIHIEKAQQTVLDTPTLDPLMQSFPELIKVNEIELNLELAEQYITLGAYASARLLLSQNQEQYSAEQQLTSQKLLNRIAL